MEDLGFAYFGMVGSRYHAEMKFCWSHGQKIDTTRPICGGLPLDLHLRCHCLLLRQDFIFCFGGLLSCNLVGLYSTR